MALGKSGGVFDGVVNSGRRIEINLHAKGIDQRLIDVALATGMPITVSPKYWAEHMGWPYQQASIRELEKPRAQKKNEFFALSSGSRSFQRYGYGDLLTADRGYGVYTRVWPGTQRVLLWADPLSAAATARAAEFCGEQGLDLFEPLSFKVRRGSGLPVRRCAYEDSTLNPHYDWQKFLYTYRLWGRCLYNPNADPDVWRRFLQKQFGPAAPSAEAALAHASRILPLVTTAHGPSAANNSYWPEMYTNMPIVESGEKTSYSRAVIPQPWSRPSSSTVGRGMPGRILRRELAASMQPTSPMGRKSTCAGTGLAAAGFRPKRPCPALFPGEARLMQRPRV